MARTPKLERIEIGPECRAVKDWFPTRESAEAILPAIRAHVQTTGETHTCVCHTHTKPPADAMPVYIGEFSLPKRLLKAKRFCPCPCCWDEFGKFGHGRIAWFPDERVIRLIGKDCFEALNPEGHAQARDLYELERERRRLTDFLLANLGRLPEVIAVIEHAVVVARAVEQLHDLLHDRFRTVRLNLWRHVRRNGELIVSVREEEFRRGEDGEMYSHEVDVLRPYAVLPAYEILDPAALHLANVLERCLDRLREYRYGERSEAAVAEMNDERKKIVAETLSRSVNTARDTIAKIIELRRFSERVTINTLRNWGQQAGCPVPFNYSHNGTSITFGPSDSQMVGVPIAAELRNDIGEIDFWTPLEPRRGR